MSKSTLTVALAIVAVAASAAAIAVSLLLWTTYSAEPPEAESIAADLRTCEANTPYGLVNVTTEVGIAAVAPPARICLYYHADLRMHITLPLEPTREEYYFASEAIEGKRGADERAAEFLKIAGDDPQVSCWSDLSEITMNLAYDNPARGGAEFRDVVDCSEVEETKKRLGSDGLAGLRRAVAGDGLLDEFDPQTGEFRER